MDTNAEKLLFALYAERSSKKPQMNTVTQNMGLTGDILGRTVNALYTAGLISGVTIKFGDEDDHTIAFATDNILLTRRGAAYVEKSLNLNATASVIQKLRKIIAKAASPEWKEVKAIAEKALQELMETG